jgi:hypothetical protein
LLLIKKTDDNNKRITDYHPIRKNDSFCFLFCLRYLNEPFILAHDYGVLRNQHGAAQNIFSQMKVNFPNTMLSSIGNFDSILDSRSTTTVFNSLDLGLTLKSNYTKYAQEDLSFSKNQGLLLKVANTMFGESVDLTEFELLVLKKTFKKSIKYTPSLPGRK